MPGNTRTYTRSDVFHFDTEACPLSRQWTLSVPILAGPFTFRTAEAALHASMFPRTRRIQRDIARAPSPKAARILARTNTPDDLPLWRRHRIDIMRWILRAKFEANRTFIYPILDATRDMPIVDHRRGDRFWATSLENDTFTGVNAHGRLWQELREHIRLDDPMQSATHWRIRIGPEILGTMYPSPARTPR